MLTNMNYRVVGEGHPVVFLHGFLESISMWEYLRFSGKYQMIFIDLPGHGASSFDKNRENSMSSIARDVIVLLEDLKIDFFHVVGHSMGGYIGLEIQRQTEKCDKLVLLNSNFWVDDLKKVEDRIRVARVVMRNKKMFLYEAIPNLFVNPEYCDKDVRLLLEDSIKISSFAIAQLSLAMSQRIDFRTFVEKEKHRILIIQGREDTIVSADKMTAEVAKAGLCWSTISTCGHMAHIEAPEKTVELIQNFLA